STFRTAPTAEEWENVRIIAFSDSETEPRGRVEKREWEINPVSGYAAGSAERPGPGSRWAQKHGSTTRYGKFTLRYPLDQDRAMRENMAWVERARPDLVMVAGDLVQGAGYQPAWDEFFGYVAGEHGDLASSTPLVTALGNWETYAALNDGYGTPEDRSPVVRSRNKYHVYFDVPETLSIGRRTNGQMISFYCTTPSTFHIGPLGRRWGRFWSPFARSPLECPTSPGVGASASSRTSARASATTSWRACCRRASPL
ncbi:MAG TPA: metallophosphoesterase, partial [Nocardioides sp.]